LRNLWIVISLPMTPTQTHLDCNRAPQSPYSIGARNRPQLSGAGITLATRGIGRRQRVFRRVENGRWRLHLRVAMDQADGVYARTAEGTA